MTQPARRRFTAFSLAIAILAMGIFALAVGSRARWPGLLAPASINSLKLLAANLLCLALVLGLVLHGGHPRLGWLRSRWLVYLGTISYGIYLYHHILFKVWDDLSSHYGWSGSMLVDLVKLGIALALASLSWHCVERPILSLKDRFRYQAGRKPEVVPGAGPAETWAAEAT